MRHRLGSNQEYRFPLTSAIFVRLLDRTLPFSQVTISLIRSSLLDNGPDVGLLRCTES